MKVLIIEVYKFLSRFTLRPVAGAIVKLCSVVLPRVPGLPIIYFLLPNMHTGCILTLHVLRKIQVTTGRRVIVISSWPFWPADTAKDQFFTSFIHGLVPKFHYIWIPLRLQRSIRSSLNLLARLLQRHEDLYLPVGLQSTVRWTSSTTMNHADILNQGSRILLHIPKSHEHEMETQLKALGVPPDGWFVCVHAREHGWFKELNTYDLQLPSGYRHEQEDHRNVNIEDYYPAIDHITSLGGTVVRMGDPSMKPMGYMEGVIDYPFTQQKSLAMDLYLVSNCRFVLGCNTGFSSFPLAFGIPVLITNFTATATSAWYPYSNNIFLFQHLVEIESGKRLDPERNFDRLISKMNDTLHFAALGYRCQPNSPEEILEATKEILDLIENDSFDHPRSTEQELFHQYRLQAVNALWSQAQHSGDNRFSPVRSSQSRISASFAAHYLTNG